MMTRPRAATPTQNSRFEWETKNVKIDTITHNQLMDHLNNLDEGSIHWDLQNIVFHQGPLNKNHPSHMGSPHNIKVEWENGEITEEPLNVIAADAPVACAICGKKRNLLNQPGWK